MIMKPLAIIGICAGVLMLSLYFSNFLQSANVEAQSPQRFQIQATERPGKGYLEAICDTATGNLIYKSNYSSYGTALAVIPNGCQKNPR